MKLALKDRIKAVNKKVYTAVALHFHLGELIGYTMYNPNLKEGFYITQEELTFKYQQGKVNHYR